MNTLTLTRLRAFLEKVIKSSLAKNTFSLYAVHIANYLPPIITIPYLTRHLSPEGYGLVAYSLSFASIFNVLFDYGFNLTAARDVSAYREDKERLGQIVSEVFWTKLFLALVATIVFIILVSVLPALQPYPTIFWLGFLGVLTMTFLPTWLFQGLENLPRLALVTVIARLAQIPAMFLFVHTKEDVAAWLWIILVSSTVATFIGWFLALRGPVSHLQWVGVSGIHHQLKHGVAVFLSQASVSLYTSLNTFLLGTMTTLTIAGYFASAEKIARLVFSIVLPLTQGLFPRMTRLVAEGTDDALKWIRRAFLTVGSMGLTLSLALFVFAPLIVTIVLGNSFQDVIPILRVMSLLPFLFALGLSATLFILMPYKLDKFLLLTYLCAGVVNLIFAFTLVPRFGAVGMAWAVVLAELTVVVTQLFVVQTRGTHLLRTRGVNKREV